MAVVITSDFYQAAAWKDISKVVFTSPNMDSPATAGTRSHILPGEGALGLWYEDTSQLFRIETSQSITETDYYNYISSTSTVLNMDLPSPTVTVTGIATSNNFDVFYEHVKDSVGCTPIGYDSVSMAAAVQEVRVKLEYSTGATGTDELGYLDNIISTTINTPSTGTIDVYELSTVFAGGDTHNDAWVVEVIGGLASCYLEIDLDKPYKVTKIFLKGEYAYDVSTSGYHHKRFFGNYKIYGKLNSEDGWTEMYDGANTSSIESTIFLSSNDSFYKYYKINIENNTGLTGCNTSYYALSALQFFTFEYDDIPTNDMPMYNFKTNGDSDIIYISDITDLGSSTYLLDIASVTGASGTLPIGTELKGWGTLTGNVDFETTDSVVFEVTIGEAYNCRLTAWDDVTHSTTVNELIQGDHVRVSAAAFCCTDSKLVPGESNDPINYVYGPVHNRILKGNTVDSGTNLFFGDFDLVYRFDADVYGDLLIFKPMLYNITDSVSYGVHDYLITLHYAYT